MRNFYRTGDRDANLKLSMLRYLNEKYSQTDIAFLLGCSRQNISEILAEKYESAFASWLDKNYPNRRHDTQAVFGIDDMKKAYNAGLNAAGETNGKNAGQQIQYEK